MQGGMGADAEDPVMRFVRSGFERNGLQFLLKAVSLMTAMKDLRIWVLGKGSLGSLQSQAVRLGIEDRVHFAGAVADPERWKEAADLIVLPTISDPFANVCLEAMAAGLPVVTSRTNGVEEVLPSGTDGSILDDPLTASGLAKVLRKLTDGGLLRAIGQATRGRALRFPWPVTAGRTLITSRAILAEG